MSRSNEIPWTARDWLLTAALAVAPYVSFSGALQRNTAFVSGDGIVDLPYRILTARRVWSGEWPFWAPEILGGADLWSYPVSAVLHPLTYLFGVLPPLLFLNIFVLGVYSLALVGTYLFGRQWGLDRAGSTVAAISYSFSGFFFSYFSVAAHGIGHAAAFVPLLLASYLYLSKAPGPKRAALAALATFGLGVIGQDQIFLYGMVQAGYVVIATIFINESDKRKSIPVWAAIAAVLGACALSIRLIPNFEWLRESGRSDVISVLMNVTHTAPPSRLWPTLFKPYSDDFPTQMTYFGFISVFLLVVGLGKLFKSRRISWAFGGICLALINLYWSNFIAPKYYLGVPVLGWFHSPFRHMFELFLWASILSGSGMMVIVRERGISVLRVITAGLVVVVCAILTNYGRWSLPLGAIGGMMDVRLFPFMMVAALIMAIGFLRGMNAYMRWAGVLIAFLLMGMLNGHHFKNHMAINQARDGFANMEINPLFLQRLKQKQNEAIKSAPLDRSIYIGSPYKMSLEQRLETAAPNFGMFLGFPSVQAKHELLQKRYVEFMGEDSRVGCFLSPLVLNWSKAALDLLNTRYIIVPNMRNPADPRNWPDLLKSTLITIDGPQMPILGYGEKINLSWQSAPPSSRLILLCSIYFDVAFQLKPALEIQINDSEKLIFNEKLYEIKDITQKKMPDGSTGRKIYTGWLFNMGRTYWSEIELPLPPGKGPFACSITSLLEKGTVAIAEAVLVDSSGNVIERFYLINNYIDTLFHYPVIYSDKYVTVYERPTAFGRQWLASRIEALLPEQILDEIGNASRNANMTPRLKDIALVEDKSLTDFGESMLNTVRDETARIDRTVDRPNYIAAKVTSKTPSFAVFSEAWAKGWKATLDGKPVPIYRADYYLRGIAVPAGEHLIEMRYTPPGFIVGAIISIFSLTIILVGAIWPKTNYEC